MAKCHLTHRLGYRDMEYLVYKFSSPFKLAVLLIASNNTLRKTELRSDFLNSQLV